MRTEALGAPLTVWVGSRKYTFPAGRDVTVGRDTRSDIRLDGADASTSPTHVVLHHDGKQWVALDRSQHGIYVDGVRMSTVFIRDGRALTIGDPRHGPRLLFQLSGVPPGRPGPPPPRGPRPSPPPPAAMGREPGQRGRPAPPPRQPPPRPGPPKRPPPPQRPPAFAPPGPPGRRPVPPAPPSQLPTQGFRSPAPEPESAPPRAESTPSADQRPVGAKPPSEAPTRRFRSPQPTPEPPPPDQPPQPPTPPPPPPQAHPEPQPFEAPPEPPPTTQSEGPDLVGRMTGAMQRLIPQRPEPRPHEMMPTSPLPHAEVTHSEAPPQKPAALGTLEAEQLGLNVDGQPVLVDVSFTAQPGTLIAVIGPSKAARSALVHLVAGEMRPSLGEVTIGGHDVHDDYASLRTRIGVVGPYDVVHPQLTIEQALGYIAELRLPPSTSADERRHAVNRVITELQLNALRTIQVGKLSDEQRQRASLASELITAPSLLVIDEPVAASDPQTMALLRRLADGGRVVVVSTASPDHVDVCDQVLLLAPQGTPAFVGPPAEIDDALRSANWDETLELAGAVQHRLSPRSAQPRQIGVESLAPPEHLGLWRQFGVAVRRQAWILVGDQRYFTFLTILPVLFGALTLVVSGQAGLGQADPYGNGPDEALEILVVLNLGAVFMGTALAIRDLFGERRILRREQSGGLSTLAYLAAKLVVYSLAALVQTGIITTVAVAGKGAPARGAVLLGSPVVELYLTLAVTAVVSAIVALALSSLAKYREQLLLVAVLVILLSFLFSGAAFPLAGRFGLEQISWLLPSRWGYAASASTVDLPAVNVLAASDELWTHSVGWWVFDMAMLIGLGAVCAAFLYWRLRRRAEPGTAVSETAATGLPDAGTARYGQV